MSASNLYRPHDRVPLKEMKADWHACLDNKVGFKVCAFCNVNTIIFLGLFSWECQNYHFVKFHDHAQRIISKNHLVWYLMKVDDKQHKIMC